MKFKLTHTNCFFHVAFAKPVQLLSSAVLNGGYQLADHFFNVKVDANFKGEKKKFESPVLSLSELAESQKWKGTCVGMMTAAFMSSFRRVRFEKQGVWIEVLLTAGVSNARRAGDTADYQFMNTACEKLGTINILALTNAQLSKSAMVECIMMIAEAKAACMQSLAVKSPVSKEIATGTGTDSSAIACGYGSKIDYCGKHVLFGELLAKAVIQAVSESLSEGK